MLALKNLWLNKRISTSSINVSDVENTSAIENLKTCYRFHYGSRDLVELLKSKPILNNNNKKLEKEKKVIIRFLWPRKTMKPSRHLVQAWFVRIKMLILKV